jgi:hypothetical protein
LGEKIPKAIAFQFYYEKRRELESLASFPAGMKSDPCGPAAVGQPEIYARIFKIMYHV